MNCEPTHNYLYSYHYEWYEPTQLSLLTWNLVPLVLYFRARRLLLVCLYLLHVIAHSDPRSPVFADSYTLFYSPYYELNCISFRHELIL